MIERTGPRQAACSLCVADDSEVVWQGSFWRLVAATDVRFPGYLVLVHQGHVGEMTDLPHEDQTECFRSLLVIESLLREHLNPTKMNVAQLGNRVPHLHWHIIPRFEWDSHYPESIWGPQQREPDTAAISRASRIAMATKAALAGALAGGVDPQ